MPPRHVKGQKDSLAVFQYVLTWSSRLLCLTSWLLNLLCNAYGQTLIDQYTVIQFSHHHSFLMCYWSDVDIICSSMLIFLSTILFVLGYLLKYPIIIPGCMRKIKFFRICLHKGVILELTALTVFPLSGTTSEAHLAIDSGWSVSEWQVTSWSGHSEELQ